MTMLKVALRRTIPAGIHPYSVLRSRIESRSKGTVLFGPFTGMNYGAESICSAYYPKILGTYEKELGGIIEEIVRLRPGVIVDIGAAEGYYVCGFARRLPDVDIVAFEAELRGRYLLRRNCELNKISHQVSVTGFCNPEGLAVVLERRTGCIVVLCDAEGHECELLDCQAVPALKKCHILVEMHDFILPGLTEILQSHFVNTHSTRRIQAIVRTPADFPLVEKSLYDSMIPGRYYSHFVDEGRPPKMSWLWMSPRQPA